MKTLNKKKTIQTKTNIPVSVLRLHAIETIGSFYQYSDMLSTSFACYQEHVTTGTNPIQTVRINVERDVKAAILVYERNRMHLL